MPYYNLNALNPTDFEHLTQALALKFLGTTVSIFGAGPDGAREATFHGKVQSPLAGESWDGYGVIQAKFKAQPSPDHAVNFNWLKQELKSEMRKFASKKRALKRPEYYVFVTNVPLTAAQNGTHDKLRQAPRRA